MVLMRLRERAMKEEPISNLGKIGQMMTLNKK
jgi:hypothetical protein